jgi:hypothetical protein
MSNQPFFFLFLSAIIRNFGIYFEFDLIEG